MADFTVKLHDAQRDLDDNSRIDQHDLALASYMSSLALELKKHYNDVSGDEQTLEEAADMAERATLIASDQDPDLPRYYNDLGLIRWDLYYHTGFFDTLTSAISAARQAIERVPEDSQERLRYLDNLSYMLLDEFKACKDYKVLRESLETVREVAQLCPYNHPDRLEYVDNYGRALVELSIRTDSVDDLEQGLGQVRRLVNGIPDDHPCRAQCLSTLASMLWVQYGFRRGKAMGEEFEMGGTWVHWNQPHVCSEIYRYNLQGNLKTSAGTVDAKSTLYAAAFSEPSNLDGKETAAAVQRAADAFFAIDGLTSRDLMRQPALWTKYDHLSAKDRLDQLDIPQIEKDLFDGMISSFGSVPGSQCGFTEVLRWYALGGHSMAGVFEHAGIFKLGKGGMTSLALSILSEYRGRLLFETTIDAVKQDKNSVTLNSKNGRTVKARYVISTIPLNCLADVTFSPPLSPLRQEAVNAGHINQGAKIHFKMRETEDGWFSMASGYGASPWCFAFSDHNGTINQNGTYCIGFGYGGHLTDPRANSDIISSFNAHLKPDADVEAYLTHDWMNDSLAKGTWSCWGPDSMSKWFSELQKPHGRVLFASADWANGWRGFIDGAIERGVTAAVTAAQLLSQDGISSHL